MVWEHLPASGARGGRYRGWVTGLLALVSLVFGAGLAGGFAEQGIQGPQQASQRGPRQVTHEASRPQAASPNAQAGDVLRDLYEQAQRTESRGEMAQAAGAYKQFLAAALVEVAQRRVRLGEYGKAQLLFAQAAGLAPADPKPRMAYARAALEVHDGVTAKARAQAAVGLAAKDPAAHLLLGEALLQLEEGEPARKQMEAAVALEPNYANGYALAIADLANDDNAAAAKLFGEMKAAYGDGAAMHLDFGRAYAEAGFPDQAIVEFRQAIAKDDVLPEAHYCLGAAIILAHGPAGFADAVKEFRRELELRPNDYFSLAQLGYVALTEHNLAEALDDLTRASSLDSGNPDNFLLLGQLYVELKRPTDAEAAFRKSIGATNDLSRNRYQVLRTHFLLGRVLMQSGRAEEGKKEMKISSDLMHTAMVNDQSRLRKSAPDAAMPGSITTAEVLGPSAPQHLQGPAPVSAAVRGEMEGFERQLAPAIADSYNNLGAITATGEDFQGAVRLFEQAAQWQPSLEGLDYNWGRAAFSGKLYAEAVAPLTRYVAAHAQDVGAHSVLGLTCYQLGDYAAALRALRPVDQQLGSLPAIGLVYAAALVKTAHFGEAIPRLSALGEKPAAELQADQVHQLLGEAYTGEGEYGKAAVELRRALELNPHNAEAGQQLQLALLHLGLQVQGKIE